MLTQKQIQFLIKLVINAPLQGNLQTLPAAMQELGDLLRALEDINKSFETVELPPTDQLQ